MNTLKGILIGLGIGVGIDLLIALGSCTANECANLTCSNKPDTSMLLPIGIVLLIMAVFIGGLIGFAMDMSDKSYEKRKKMAEDEKNRQILEAQVHRDLVNRFVTINETAFKKADNSNNFIRTNDGCKYIIDYLNNNLTSPYYGELKSIYEKYKNNHLKLAQNEILKLKNRREITLNGYNAMIFLCNHLHFYNLMSGNIYTDLITRMRVYIDKIKTRSYFIDEEEYGKINDTLFAMISEQKLNYLQAFSEANVAFEKFINFYKMNDLKNFNSDFFDNTIKAIYGLAFQKPFDVKKYLTASNMLETLCYTLYFSENHNNEVYFISPIDCLFSKIIGYSRMGKGVLKQIKNEIDFWVDAVATGKTGNNPNDLVILSSGLMWLGEYELELEILRKAASAGVQLKPEVQERLGFLESGGSTGPELHIVNNNDIFNYDYSALKWKNEDFSNFFKNLAFKNTRLNYALAVSEFRKSFKSKFKSPITYDMNLEKMTQMADEEYLNDIECKLVKVNSLSEEFDDYDEAILIKPTENTDINHAGILLFYNKIGVNINIQILTIFIPVQSEDMQKNMRLAISLKQETSPKTTQTLESIRDSAARQIDELCESNPDNDNSIY